MSVMTSRAPAQGAANPNRNLVRWGAVFSGGVVGLGVFVLLSALWLALAHGSGQPFWRDNLDWWVGGTAIFAMFLAGLLAGYLSGARGVVAGLANSLTLWGLVTVAALLGGIPVGVGYFGGISTSIDLVPGASLWTVFWSLLIGLGAVLLGGAICGAPGRRAARGDEVEGYDVERREVVAHRDEELDLRERPTLVRHEDGPAFGSGAHSRRD